MEKSHDKINNFFKKLPFETRTLYSSQNNSNLKDILSPKKVEKRIPYQSRSKKNLIKSIGKNHTSSQKKLHQKSYIFNKTSNGSKLGTPTDKSAMLSYISTPNQRSINFDKRMKALKKVSTVKGKEQFRSTEEDYYSQSSILVNFTLSGKIFLQKKMANFASFKTLRQEFAKQVNTSTSKVVEKCRQNYQSIIGFQCQPTNHALSEMINDGAKTFQIIASQGIKQITLEPLFLKKPLDYDNLTFKDFEIIKYLGSGGFSQVYLARCKLDNKLCALKFIKKQTITSMKKVKMLQNERDILFSIKHNNLIDLYYAFESKNYIIFGLQYCPNGNLYSYLQKMKTLKQDDARIIFRQILQGLEYLHSMNILFRDIKLQNILFDSEGGIKITDFGLSKPGVNEEDITYSYCGSPQYMAPQMLLKSGHSYEIDYYALGILLYELIYGRSPFYAPKKQEIFFSILNSQPRFPKFPPISKELKSLIKGLLAKNPNHRIGSLKGVKQILAHPWLKCDSGKQNIHTQVMGIDFSPKLDNFMYEDQKYTKAKKQFLNEQKIGSFQNCFFDRSYVNRNLIQKVSKTIIKLKESKQFKKKK